MDVLAERDGLTGLFNRKYLSTILRQEFTRAKRYGTDLSLLLLDIDHFKDTNLIQGHLFSDFVLNEIAPRITSNTRDSDICFRFGGGNFVVLLPQTQICHAQKVAEKLNYCCSKTNFDNVQNSQKVTISIGITSLGNSTPKSPEQFIHMADRAMYQAKSNGRDRYQQYQETG
jgi:diguanylate cyclase (GGDEF)-like protein